LVSNQAVLPQGLTSVTYQNQVTTLNVLGGSGTDDFTVDSWSGPSAGTQPPWFPPVFDAACGRLAAAFADAGRRGEQRDGFGLDRFVPLILRLYEQFEQACFPQLRPDRRCGVGGQPTTILLAGLA